MADFTLTAQVKPEVDEDALQDQLDGGTFSVGGRSSGRTSENTKLLGTIKSASLAQVGLLTDISGLFGRLKDSFESDPPSIRSKGPAGPGIGPSSFEKQKEALSDAFRSDTRVQSYKDWQRAVGLIGEGVRNLAKEEGHGGLSQSDVGGPGMSGMFSNVLTEMSGSLNEAAMLQEKMLDRLVEIDDGINTEDDRFEPEHSNKMAFGITPGMVKGLASSLIGGLMGAITGGGLLTGLATTLVSGLVGVLTSPITLTLLAGAALVIVTDFVTKIIDGLQEKFRPAIINFLTEQLGLPDDLATAFVDLTEDYIDIIRAVFRLDWEGFKKEVNSYIGALGRFTSAFADAFKGLGKRFTDWIISGLPSWALKLLGVDPSSGGGGGDDGDDGGSDEPEPRAGVEVGEPVEGGDQRLINAARRNQRRAGERVEETATAGTGGGANQATGSTSPTVGVTIEGQSKAQVQREIDKALEEFNRNFRRSGTGRGR